MPNLGPMEIMIVFVVALLVLGPKRLPEAGRQVGKALAEVRKWSSSVQHELREALETESEPQLPAAAPPPITEAATGEAPAAPTPVDLEPSPSDRPE